MNPTFQPTSLRIPRTLGTIFAAAILASMILLLWASPAPAIDDWPQWMGPRMDGVWRESGVIDSFAESGPVFLWRQPIGAGYSGPSVVGKRLYVMDRTADKGQGGEVENGIKKAGQIAGGERILCLDTDTGKTVWEKTYDCPYNIAYPTGPRCTPLVEGDRVYTLGAMGHLKCMNTDDGEIVWERLLTKDYDTRPPAWGFASHPIVDGPRLIVPVGGKGSAVVAFDKQTGKEVWRSGTTSDIAYAPLVFYESEGERQLIFWHGDGVDSLNSRTGQPYWHVTWPEQKAQPQATTIITPRIVANQIFFSEFYKGSLLLEIGSNPPAVKEIYRSFSTDPRHRRSLNALMTTPVVRDGRLYGVTGTGEFRCIDWDTGEMIWNQKTWMGKKRVTFATVFIVENENRYFMFNDLGELMLVRLTPEGIEELDRAPILAPTGVARGQKVVWSHPAFSGGKMYARNDEEIVCVDLRKPAAKKGHSPEQNGDR